ncbi:MAG TPA: FixH family protein [Gemmatimonadaceae bacterium]|nr:FixH family protein [Gemmatimonadaceae bacterium]
MKRGSSWPIGVAVVLAATVALNIWVYRVANDDPSFAIEPDYYQKAMAWDSTMAQARENVALGWRLSPTLAAFTEHDGAVLQVTLTDSSGTAIPDATVKVAAFFNARANDVIDTTLARDSTGYAVTLPVTRGGVWELQFDVQRGRQRFTAISRVEAVPARAGT